jgi:uncharacterized protein Smg (DUF494 family)
VSDGMPEQLRDLLMILREALGDPGSGDAGRRTDLQDRLAAAGYDGPTLQVLLDWVASLSHSPLHPDWMDAGLSEGAAGYGVRFYGEQEQQVFTPPAFGYLLDLCQEGQITRQQMESLIQYASLVSMAPLDRRGVEHLLDQVFFASFGSDSAHDPADRPGPFH